MHLFLKSSYPWLLLHFVFQRALSLFALALIDAPTLTLRVVLDLFTFWYGVKVPESSGVSFEDEVWGFYSNLVYRRSAIFQLPIHICLCSADLVRRSPTEMTFVTTFRGRH